MKSETIEETIAAWSAEPDQARVSPAVTAHAEQSQAVIEAGPFSWRADLPAPLGGTNQAPSPSALLLSALASCAVVFIGDTLAPQLGMEVRGVEATVRCETDLRGLLGLDGTEPDLRSISLEVSVDSPDGDAAVAELATVWQQRCPVYLALLNPTEVSVIFSAA